MSILDLSVKDYKRYLSAKLVNLDSVGAHPPIHDVFPTRQLDVPLLKTNGRSVVCLDDSIQGNRELVPPFLRILPQGLDGFEDHHGVLGGGINVDHLTRGGFLKLPDPGLQAIILLYMFSFLAKQRNRTHRPCSVPE